MFSVDAKPELEQLSRALSELGSRQLPFVLALAATETAKLVKSGTRKVMSQRLDRPTEYTLNSIFTVPANKTGKSAVVGYKDKGSGVTAGDFMQTPVRGGVLKAKRLDKALQARGLLKNGQRAIPLPAIMNDEGNVKGRLVKRILKSLDASSSGTAPKRRKSSKASSYFVAEVGGTNGIWERKIVGAGDEGIRPVFIFSDEAPRRRKVLPFFAVAENIVKANYMREFSSALDHAIKTARK